MKITITTKKGVDIEFDLTGKDIIVITVNVEKHEIEKRTFTNILTLAL